MATPTFTRTSKNVKGFTTGKIFIAELTAADAIAASSDWSLLGWTKECNITQEMEEYSEQDDSGSDVLFEETVKTVMVEGKFLARDEAVRQLFGADAASFKGRSFAMLILGAKLDKAAAENTEVWMFAKGQFSRAFAYALGSADAKYGYKFKAFKTTVATLHIKPSIAAFTGELASSTGSFTQAKDQFFYTAEVS
jgi:hypothetical protein